MDIRNDGAIQSAMKEAADKFGGIDILINNASAISLTGTAATDPKRFDLMMGINARGTYMWSDLFLVFHFNMNFNKLPLHLLNLKLMIRIDMVFQLQVCPALSAEVQQPTHP